MPASEIDGGWAVNGWLQYAHPENAKRAPNGDVAVNHVNASGLPARYELANAGLSGWTIVKTIPYQQWAGRSGSIFVLQRGPDSK